jgi:hypothetical protein
MRISTNQVSSVMHRPKKLERGGTERADKNQIESHETEPNPSKDRAMHEGDNPLFKIYLFLDSSIHIRIFQQVPKVLRYWSRIYSPLAEASMQGLKCKTNTYSSYT